MNVPKQVAKLCQGLPPDEQEEGLDFVAFLVSRQWHTSWTVEKRQEAVARTMGCLRHTRTSSAPTTMNLMPLSRRATFDLCGYASFCGSQPSFSWA
jgi:hypothetical protein